MVRTWKAVVLVNLALGLGFGMGYLSWNRQVRQLRDELVHAQEGNRTSAALPQHWTVTGIVRIVLPAQRAVFITHDTIPGLMEGMTMGFEVESATLLDGLGPGDTVRFTVRRDAERLLVVGMARQGAR